MFNFIIYNHTKDSSDSHINLNIQQPYKNSVLMINQEDLYQYLYNENWKEILDILYEERENIKADTLLTYASNIFVIEFLNKVDNYEKEDKEILENLVTLNILHHGKILYIIK
ncbi:hypothetical protein NV63_18610 [Elizabethkingia anophelis]|nr:hypothetical protein NV63_18610 [Elizabethkingia anophelis]